MPSRRCSAALGVFVGGFTLEAAEAIAGGPADAFEVIDGITSLIEHSLLQQRVGRTGVPRYRMLETVREFARDRLRASQEHDAVQRRHADIFLAFAERSEPELTGPNQVEWLDSLEGDKENTRAALHWSVEQGEVGTATRLGAALWMFWRRRGYLSEGREQLARILALQPSPECFAARCSVLTGMGALALFQGDYDQAIRHSGDALEGWRQIGDQRGIGRSLLCLAIVARYRDVYAGAESLGLESLAAFRAIDDRWGIGRVLGHLGMLAWVQGDHAAGSAYYEEALANLRDAGDGTGIFEVVMEMGKGACDEGELARATALFEECLAFSRYVGRSSRTRRGLDRVGGRGWAPE